MSSHHCAYADLQGAPETYAYHMGRAEIEEDMAAFYAPAHSTGSSYIDLDLDPSLHATHAYDNAMLSGISSPYLAYADQWAPQPPQPHSRPPTASPYQQPTTSTSTSTTYYTDYYTQAQPSPSLFPTSPSPLPDPMHSSPHTHPQLDPHQPKDLSPYGHLNADGSWRCAYPGCTSPAVFRRGCDLRKHFNRHRKHLFCRHEGCPQAIAGGFSSKKDRARHEAKHNPGVECEWPDCGRVFSRVDNMKDHVRRIHRKGGGC
ncbi:putative C2H2 transcription factor [Aspergillus clavatus NRRL 1]|uniref:C2H2 type zinc finger domain protein n=1 Tax=Aspergillus clavatus (strain ATCC 1007 / CBS 513.65 / DSM 816 / NCTC 3887 / NRRL 1 / QM 1276 / 107) TaxID=344612 RepID=A1CRY0_ASPCL|nr:C2H2 type zinc finger domain protein [Aspergillus clavatus NRRL 1]EAW08401.1 C2H2 type zinc finger domain protein [Aspergillus clavatus NRRL 1]